MPCSNVDVERIFYELNNIKTKPRKKLKSSTVASILKFKQAVKHSYGSCIDFTPPLDIHRRMTSSILYPPSLCSATDDIDSDSSSVASS